MTPRVLVVDDEPLIVHNLRAFLEDDGIPVASASSAEEAIARIEGGEDYDVCIMDLRLPGIDGNRAVQTLHARRPSLKFVIHTGSSNYVIPTELRAMGIDDAQLFRKPVADMRPLVDMVRRLARGDRDQGVAL
jgi:CheY-like chemotaxis protein